MRWFGSISAVLKKCQNRWWKRIIFYSIIALGISGASGFFTSEAIPFDEKWKFGLFMVVIAIFCALAGMPTLIIKRHHRGR